MPKKFDEADFDNYSMPVTECGCWVWMAGIRPDGYGRWKGRLAHVVSYERHKGPVPQGLELDHLCRVRCCVNPDHLEAVTHSENIRRGHGWGYIHRQKTHCPKGHAYDEENTYTYKNGKYVRRCCRACNNRISLERYYAHLHA